MAATGNGGRKPKNPQNGSTRYFSAVNYRDARLAKEKQRRQYEQQKKEKIIFALFVVIIIVLILVAILVFKKVIDSGAGSESQTDTESATESLTNQSDTGPTVPPDNFRLEMCGKDRVHSGDLILVNQTYTFQSSIPALADIYTGRTKFQKGDKTVYSYYTADTTPQLSKETLTALNKMADDFFKATGNNDLYVNLAYDASTSDDHATGLAVDLSVFTIDNKLYRLDDKAVAADFAWIFSNYYKYGFVMESPSQTGERYYHFRYVGIPVADMLFKNKLGLAELLQMLRDKHCFADGKTNSLTFTADDSGKYEMYYVAASAGDMTSVPISDQALHCTISGDNMNGFIVTTRIG